MRIAVNTRFLLKDKLEGIGQFTYQTLRYLTRQYPEHEFIFFFDRPYDPSFIFSENITPVVLYPPARHPFLFVAWFEWSVARDLKQYKADIFISPDNFLCLNTDIPTILVVHDIAFVHFSDNDKWINRLYYRYFMPRFLKKAQHILTVSTFTQQDIMAHFDVDAAKMRVCYNGCRDGFYPKNSLDTVMQSVSCFQLDGALAPMAQDALKGGYFFYMGAVHPRKNVHRLIEAFDAFKKETLSPLKLVIAGRLAWQTGAVKEAYEAALHKTDIVFKGYVNDDEALALMQSALGFVYVSTFEGFGIPLLEAMNCDIPIITSNISSMPEVVGEAAILVNPESVEDIKKALNQLAFDRELRQILIEKGRIQRQKFSWEKTAETIMDIVKLYL